MSTLAQCFFLGAILTYIVTSIVAYHFDVDNIIMYEDPTRHDKFRGSYFGYSSALWNPNESSNKSWIFIGAPRANSSAYQGDNEPGNVFKCEIGKPCEEWIMAHHISESFAGSWLGGTMNIENKTNPTVVVCGPRWMEKKLPIALRHMKGICYKIPASDFFDSNSHSPGVGKVLTQRHITYVSDSKINRLDDLNQQIGFSMHIIPNTYDLEFVLGCPGVNNWKGTSILSKNSGSSFVIPYGKITNVKFYDYFGYAVTSGKYFTTGTRVYVAGAPRSANFHGSIILFNFPKVNYRELNVYEQLKGNQKGEYFGSVLASCDVDGDGRDNLLVGSPQWTKNIDEGRIYVFRAVDSQTKAFESPEYLYGQTPRGRFGSTITCLGDIDYDGYADVAVGAPYDGENGAVYIFHGDKIKMRLSQKIYGPKYTKGFGISISEPRDIDNNGYADIAIGAHLSGHVTLFKSKRVISMTVNLSSNLVEKHLQRDAKSFSISICSSYRGAYAPPELMVVKDLRIDPVYERATIEVDGKNVRVYSFYDTLKLNPSPSCRNLTINVKKENVDFLNPLKLYVTQRLNTFNKKGTLIINQNGPRGEEYFCTSCATTDALHSSVKDQLTIPFIVECGNDNICYSRLSVEILTNHHYVFGSEQYINLDVKVSNFGQNAFLTKAIITILSFIEFYQIPPTCIREHKATNTEITCDVDNPLEQNKSKIINLKLDMSKIPLVTKTIDIKTVAITESKDAASGKHETNFLINCVMEADIGITGKTDMDWYSYIHTQEGDQLPNILFQHTYEIKNYKRTPLMQALLSVSFPTHWIHDDNEIEIIKLNETINDLDGQNFHFTNANETTRFSSLHFDASKIPEWLNGNNSSKSMPQAEKKFTIIEGQVLSASPENRTLYINCTNPLIKCTTIDYILGPFKSARSAAKVVLTFELLLANFRAEKIQEKDIIFFVTNGSTGITMPPNYIQTVNDEPDVIMIGTILVGTTPQYRVALWVYGVSVFFGLLLLILVIFVLLKFGFFKRTQKMKLEELKKDSENVKPRVVLETNSTTDILNTT